MSGWISLHRKIQDNKLWKEPRVFSKAEAWIDILMEVQHSEKRNEIVIKNTTITCDRGQSIKSIQTWAERWTWSKSAVQRFLKWLKREKMITLENLKKTTRLSVCKYETYQKKRIASESQVNRKRIASESQVNTDNKVNNDNNDNNDNNSYAEVKEYWNSKDNIVPIRSLTPKRILQLRVRLAEPDFKWKQIIDRINSTPFCTGTNDRGWKADFDWLIKNEDNYTKVMEGKYGEPTKPKQDMDKIKVNQWYNQCGAWLQQTTKEMILGHPNFTDRLKEPKFRAWAETVNPIIKEIQ